MKQLINISQDTTMIAAELIPTTDTVYYTPLLPHSKEAFKDGWNLPENLEAFTDEALQKLQEGFNIGVVVGEPAGGLLDVDIDAKNMPASDETRRRFLQWARKQLPKTGCVWGRGKDEPAHFLYRLKDAHKGQHKKWAGGIMETRYTSKNGKCHQTMIPPSVHPDTGEPLVWIERTYVAEVEWSELESKVRFVAAVGLLVGQWSEGKRQDLALCIAGALARAGYDEHDVRSLINDITYITNDRESEKRFTAVHDTFTKFRNGENTTGLPTLKTLIGEANAKHLCELLKIRENEEQPIVQEENNEKRKGDKIFRFYRDLLPLFQPDVRFVDGRNEWAIWTGKVWIFQKDESRIVSLARKRLREYYEKNMNAAQTKAEYEYYARAYHNLDSYTHLLTAAVKDLRDGEGINVPADAFDNHPHLINTQTGIVNIHTLELIPHSPEYYFTQITSAGYVPESDCPRFKRFLYEIMSEDKAMTQYLLQTIAAGVYGKNETNSFFYWYGRHANNGKSTLVQTLQRTLGSYIAAASREALDTQRKERRGLAVLSFVGKRMAFVEELGKRNELDSSLLKLIATGGADRVRRNYDTEEREVYLNTMLIITSNTQLRVDELDSGVQRRLKIIPFNRVFTPDNENRNMLNELSDEKDGILTLLLKTAHALYQRGWKIDEPDTIKTARREYIITKRAFDIFINECTIKDEHLSVSAKALTDAFLQFIHDEDIYEEFVENSLKRPSDASETEVRDALLRWIGYRMRDMNFKKKVTNRGAVYLGLDLRTTTPPDDGGLFQDGEDFRSGGEDLRAGGEDFNSVFEFNGEEVRTFSEKTPENLKAHSDDAVLNESAKNCPKSSLRFKTPHQHLTNTSPTPHQMNKSPHQTQPLQTEQEEPTMTHTTESLRQRLLDYGAKHGYPRIVVHLRVYDGETAWRGDIERADHDRLMLWADCIALNDAKFHEWWQTTRSDLANNADENDDYVCDFSA